MNTESNSKEIIEGSDFCLEDSFREALKRGGQSVQNLASPEILRLLEGRRITALRLKNVHDRVFSPDGTILYLEIEVAPSK